MRSPVRRSTYSSGTVPSVSCSDMGLIEEGVKEISPSLSTIVETLAAHLVEN